MKKYIRRANGVYELKIDEKLKKANVVNYFYITDNENKNHNILFKKKDLEKFKQSDTIEELCDEFVVIYKKHKKFTQPFISLHLSKEDLLKEHDLNECKIYGAIWTDKGLIYVAKMNDKGELELL